MFPCVPRSKRPGLYFTAMLATGLLLSPRAGALSYTYDFDHTLSGVAPAGPTPWLTATFSDTGPNAVQLTLAAPGLTGAEFVGSWFFNLNPALDPRNLVFSSVGSSGTFAAPVVMAGADAFKPDWDGKYDIFVRFDSGADASAHFGGGDSITFNISDPDGLSAIDFYTPNTPVAGHGALFTAAGIETVGEAVVIDALPPVPDGGTTIMLLGFSLLMVEGARRRARVLRRHRG
jgi:hypothetical protein